MTDLILAHVPESEYLTYDEALALAEERDEQVADAFMQSVPDSEKMPVLITRMPDDAEALTFTPLTLPLDPRRTWGKI